MGCISDAAIEQAAVEAAQAAARRAENVATVSAKAFARASLSSLTVVAEVADAAAQSELAAETVQAAAKAAARAALSISGGPGRFDLVEEVALAMKQSARAARAAEVLTDSLEEHARLMAAHGNLRDSRCVSDGHPLGAHGESAQDSLGIALDPCPARSAPRAVPASLSPACGGSEKGSERGSDVSDTSERSRSRCGRRSPHSQRSPRAARSILERWTAQSRSRSRIRRSAQSRSASVSRHAKRVSSKSPPQRQERFSGNVSDVGDNCNGRGFASTETADRNPADATRDIQFGLGAPSFVAVGTSHCLTNEVTIDAGQNQSKPEGPDGHLSTTDVSANHVTEAQPVAFGSFGPQPTTRFTTEPPSGLSPPRSKPPEEADPSLAVCEDLTLPLATCSQEMDPKPMMCRVTEGHGELGVFLEGDASVSSLGHRPRVVPPPLTLPPPSPSVRGTREGQDLTRTPVDLTCEPSDSVNPDLVQAFAQLAQSTDLPALINLMLSPVNPCSELDRRSRFGDPHQLVPLQDSTPLHGSRYMGTIKKVNFDRGFAFIECDHLKSFFDGDVFLPLHHLGDFRQGDKVSFELVIQHRSGKPAAQALCSADGSHGSHLHASSSQSQQKQSGYVQFFQRQQQQQQHVQAQLAGGGCSQCASQSHHVLAGHCKEEWVNYEVDVPQEYVGPIIGKGGTSIKEIMRAGNGVKIQIQKAVSHSAPQVALVVGPKAGALIAVQLLQQKIEQCQMDEQMGRPCTRSAPLTMSQPGYYPTCGQHAQAPCSHAAQVPQCVAQCAHTPGPQYQQACSAQCGHQVSQNSLSAGQSAPTGSEWSNSLAQDLLLSGFS